MNHKKLNNLATQAKAGDVHAMWEVKGHFQAYIHMLSELNRNRFLSQKHLKQSASRL